jgi:hypothetical protein
LGAGHRDVRTFSKSQVFDLGRTLENNLGFVANYNPSQGGAVNREFKVGQTLKFVFCVTADNYPKEEEFSFQIAISPSIEGQKVTPAEVSAI